MSEKMLQEDMLVQYMKQAEAVWMSRIPPEAKLHHRFSGRFLKKMRALLRYERQSVRTRKLTADLRRIAAVILLALGVGCVLTLSVDAYRAKFFEIVMEVFPELTSIRTAPKDPSVEREFEPVEPGYVPEGYEVEERTLTWGSLTITYENISGVEIYYRQSKLASGEVILDTEEADITNIEIKGINLTVIAKGGCYMFYWFDDWNQYLLIGEVDRNELLKMAESIIEKNME